MGEQLKLFAMPPPGPKATTFKPFEYPVWTENKAKLIAEYLRLFVMVTKHGAYIDGFAAPQAPDAIESWAAKLVLEQVPKQFLRELWLCDRNARRAQYLRDLAASQPLAKPPRRIQVLQGDFNTTHRAILESGRITESKATFALLDQWTFECHWDTVRALAEHKKVGNKIEIFYFLATGWLDRSLAALTTNRRKAELWWSRDDLDTLQGMDGGKRAWLLCDRFKQELGYAYAWPFPIMKKGTRGTVLYHMIHATDHPEGPKFMARAYRKATRTNVPARQLELELQALDAADEVVVDLSGS